MNRFVGALGVAYLYFGRRGTGNQGGVPHIRGDYSSGHLGDSGDYKFLTC